MLPRALAAHPILTRRGGFGCESGGATVDRIPQTGAGGFEFCTMISVRRAYALGCKVRPWRWFRLFGVRWQNSAMPDAPSERGGESPVVDPARPLEGRAQLVDGLYARAQSGR